MFSKMSYDQNRSDDEKTFEYRSKDFSNDVAERENVWRLVNFMCCVHKANFVRKLAWKPISDAFRILSYLLFPKHDQYNPFDVDFGILSKLLKCIVLIQDMNQSTKMSEVLGDKSSYVVNEALGKAIFTGSSEEGLAFFSTLVFESKHDNRLSFKLHDDIDIMYESQKMVAQEIGLSLQPIDLSGVNTILMRPGQRAGYVTLQKFIPRSVAMEMNYYSMLEAVKVYPKPEEYVEHECLLLYIPALAFLVASENDFYPRKCNCDGLDSDKYGVLCQNCKRLTLREIPRGEGKAPTKIWSNRIMLGGPAIQENAIFENAADPINATAPMNEAELQDTYEQVKKSCLSGKHNVPALQSVKPDLGDIFSSSKRKIFDIDHVPAVKCVKWPSAAWEFTVRERPSGWPPKHVIQEIVANGCHVVPRSTKPPPGTKGEQVFNGIFNAPQYVDWRLSFSIAEKILASTLNGTQVKCYILLKVLNKVVTNSLRPYRDEEMYGLLYSAPFYLDSYFLKTTFFWACEEIPVEEWKDDNLGACFVKVVQKLILLLEEGTIPNYFIPSSDLVVPVSEVNQYITTMDAMELGRSFKMFMAKTSDKIFEVLHTAVWHMLWEGTEIKPPGCTPQDLATVMNALKQDHQEGRKLFDKIPRSKKDKDNHNRKSEKATTTTTCSTTSANTDSKPKRTSDEIPDSGKTTDERLAAILAAEKSPKTNQVLAHIFSAISKFLYANGNIYGKGFNTARAAFNEEEARKLLPEGCSLDDLPEYKLPGASDSTSDSDYHDQWEYIRFLFSQPDDEDADA